jgi:hypothetical protein
MDGQHLKNRIINFVYEFKTPNGYLPIGFDYKQIGVIFDLLNNKERQAHPHIYSIRLGYDGHFKILQESVSAYDVLNLEDEYVKNKSVYELTQDDIERAINIFTIDSLHDEPIVNYVSYTDFTNILSPTTIELFQRNNFKLLIFDNKEGAYEHGFDFFDNLKRLYDVLNIDTDNQLFYITNSSDISEKYQTYLNVKSQKSFMTVKNIEFLIYDAGQPMIDYFNFTNGKSENVYYQQDVEYSVPLPHELGGFREKYFLSLNRNSGRLHRPRLVLQLIKDNLFDKGLVSMLQSDVFDDWAERPENEEYKTLIKEKYPFVVDYEDERFVSGMHNFFTNKDIWMKTYFSVVSETSSNDNWIFITEKTVRPMIYYHPFIIWGNPGTLKILKEYGFETFPEFFDESYDDMKNEDERFKKVMENINRLCSLPLNEIREMYLSVLPKLVHNNQILTKLYYERTRTKQIINLLTHNEDKSNI